MSLDDVCICGRNIFIYEGNRKRICKACDKVYVKTDSVWSSFDELEWIKDIIRQHRPTKELLIDFLYNMKWPYDLQNEAIEFAEKIDGNSIHIWNRFRAWIKICCAISLAVEYKGTGEVIFRYPSGATIICLEYNKGVFK